MFRLNNKGQTLIMFVLLLPLLLILMAFIIDIGFLYKENIKNYSVSKSIIENTYELRQNDEYEEYVKVLFKKNKIDTEKLKLNYYDNYIILSNEVKVDSFFGKIIGIKKYDIKLNLKAYKKDNKVIVIKE